MNSKAIFFLSLITTFPLLHAMHEKSTYELFYYVQQKMIKLSKLDWHYVPHIEEYTKEIKTLVKELGYVPQTKVHDPLQFAVETGDLTLIEFLLQNKADPLFKGEYERTAYSYIKYYKSCYLYCDENASPPIHVPTTPPQLIEDLLNSYAKNTAP